jgi:anaerobic dimethyl sulfoxide reductase subunit B (iron-sulfur subunit)
MATKQLGFYIDLRNCSGCKACQIACRDKNNTDVGVLWRRVYEVGGGDWQQRGDALIDNTFSYFVSSACSHCTNPACMPVCPTGAIFKRDEDGVVIIDESKCVGCRYCEWACPYGAPQFNGKTMSKCDFCQDYLAQGKNPACVDSCQMRVLKYGDIEELRAQHGSNGDIFPFPDPAITQPNTTFTPHKDSVASDYASAQILNPEEV